MHAQSEKARMLTSYKAIITNGEQDLMPLCSIPQVIILKIPVLIHEYAFICSTGLKGKWHDESFG